MFVGEKGPNQNDPNYANYLYKTEQRLLQYLKDNLPECKVDIETWPEIGTIMIRHDAFIAPIMIRQKSIQFMKLFIRLIRMVMV